MYFSPLELFRRDSVLTRETSLWWVTNQSYVRDEILFFYLLFLFLIYVRVVLQVFEFGNEILAAVAKASRRITESRFTSKSNGYIHASATSFCLCNIRDSCVLNHRCGQFFNQKKKRKTMKYCARAAR